MSKQFTYRINKGSIDRKLENFDRIIGEDLQERLVNLASYMVQSSPVDTGAYVRSHSIRPRGSSSGRMRSASGRPSLKGNPGAQQSQRDEAYGALVGDVLKFLDQIVEKDGAVVINRSPHAQDVELNYSVFAKAQLRLRG